MARPLAYEPRHALNAICPYYTMFPLEYPFRILWRYKDENPTVFDPFCGRGTTLYAARFLGLACWGVDTSAIAVAIARAKLARSTLEKVMALATTLLKNAPSSIPESDFFTRAYAPKTLIEVCSIREALMKIHAESDESTLLRAAALGCLHGPKSSRIETAGYFSNQMPRTFASKPDYSVGYWKRKRLKAPEVSVLDVLRRKLSRFLGADEGVEIELGHVLKADARSVPLRRKVQKSTSLVITSPPYYGMNTYVQDQWLRMWFLGGPEAVEYHNPEQLSHNGQEAFTEDLAKVWNRIGRSQADRVDLHVRFGSVPTCNSDAKEILKSSLEQAKGWRIVSVRPARTASEVRRQAEQMVQDSLAESEYDFHAIRD